METIVCVYVLLYHHKNCQFHFSLKVNIVADHMTNHVSNHTPSKQSSPDQSLNYTSIAGYYTFAVHTSSMLTLTLDFVCRAKSLEARSETLL